jgi:hypothetical protein
LRTLCSLQEVNNFHACRISVFLTSAFASHGYKFLAEYLLFSIVFDIASLFFVWFENMHFGKQSSVRFIQAKAEGFEHLLR